MNKTNIIIPAIALFVTLGLAETTAQVMTNNGAAIFSNSGALIFVDGEMVNQAGGTYDNNGTIELKGHWTNNAANTGFINGSPGTTLLSGGAQNIQGSDVTLFYDLVLTGTGIKTQKINAIVTDTLALNDRELATDTFVMYVTNTSTSVITRTTGFVSSLDAGGLSRNMANTANYLFPVGSSAGTLRYRPAEITPNSALAHTFKVRMANVDATTEGYDRTVNDSTLCIINPSFYHRIYRTNGANPADVTIYFDDVLDNNYQNLAHWQNLPRWENLGAVTLVSNVSPVLSSIKKTVWNDYTLPSFALGTASPSVTLSVNNATICQGDTFSFIGSAGFSNYEFFINSVSVQNSASDTFVSSGLATGDTVKLTGMYLGCTAFSNQLIVTVNPLPVINISAIAINAANCGSNAGSVTGITASGTAPLTYQWVNGSSTVVGGDSANVMNLPPDSYTLTVTSGNGCKASTGPHTVSGSPGPIFDISGLVITQSTCGASDGSITGITSSGGTSPFTFNWVNSVPASVGNALNLLNVPANIYTLTVTDSNSCTAISGPHVVTDFGAPVISTSLMVIDSSRCDLNTGAITGITVSGGIAPLSYAWSDPGVQTTLNATGLPAGSFILLVTDSAGCQASSGPHTVPNFSSPAAPTAPSPAAYCLGDVIADLTATGTGIITWYSDAPLSDTVGSGSPFTSGATTDTSFWVTATTNGCKSTATQVDITITPQPSAPIAGTDAQYCTGDPVADLTAVGTGIEWWSDPALTISLGANDTLVISPGSGTTIYYATQTTGSCQSPYDSVIITLNATPIAAIAGTTSICNGDATTLTASGGSSYLWSTLETTDSIIVNPGVTTVYSVVVSNGSCSDADTVTVTVNSVPIANISGILAVCNGVSAVLTSDLASAYLWAPTGETTQAITVNPAITTTYTLTVTNNCGQDIDSVEVNVTAITSGPDAMRCKNLEPAGYLDTLSASPLGGIWSSPNALVSPNLTPDGFVDHLSIPWGNGYAIVYSAAGCSDTLLLDVTGALTGPDTNLCPNTTNFFLPAAQPAGGVWGSDDPKVSANIIDPSTGEVIREGLVGNLTFFYSNQGCPDTMVVSLCGENDIFVPNIFSPNTDGQNDVLKVYGMGIDWVNIRIFDRWGELIYESASTEDAMNVGWNGTKKGKEMSPQVYVYYLEGAFLDGEEIFIQGNITLVK